MALDLLVVQDQLDQQGQVVDQDLLVLKVKKDKKARKVGQVELDQLDQLDLKAKKVK